MEFDSIQMALIAIFLVCAVSMVVVCDFLRKTFFRPAAQPHSHGRHRHSDAVFEEHAKRHSPGLSEFAKRTALPARAELVASQQEPEPATPAAETWSIAAPEPAVTPSTDAPIAIDAYLWESAREDAGAARSPRGMMSQSEWQQAVASEPAFTGAAVSISVNDVDGGMWHSPALMRSVSQDIAGLLGEYGFGCRTAYDEFLIACPQEQERKSRLKQITMRLWECQLRGQRARAIRIAWGGVEVRNRPLAEALASAADRMRQSQRVGESIEVGAGAVASCVEEAPAASLLAHRKAV
ncbi:MAG TPA: hypothetical protein VMB25_08110 [Bryobacteraceae bacterium]|nr:hypothetical protein [Bryobacteraceae bacterium]